MSLAKRWCFTLNNPTEDEKITLATHGEEISVDPDNSTFSYLIVGNEVGESGTPHIQGYFWLRDKKRLTQIKSIPGFGRCHLEVARGTHAQASSYCAKDNDYIEWGTASSSGNGTSFEALREWVKEQEVAPTEEDVWETFPTLAGRYPGAVSRCIELFGKRPQLVDGALRQWQQHLNDRVNDDPDDRSIIFVVDPEGNNGKSWMTRYWLTKRDGTQFLSVGKRDDLAYSVNIESDLFVFDIPRGSMEFLQYGILEQLKNRLVFSPKYSSVTKILKRTPHVVVFCNEQPDMNKLTEDRYVIMNLHNEDYVHRTY